MRLVHLLTPLPALALLAACGSSESPPAPPPGAGERLAAQLESQEEAERRATVRRIEREAAARQAMFERRIAAIEREEARP